MGTNNKYHYSSKHPEVNINPKIAEKIKDSVIHGSISCKAGHKISEKLSVSPQIIGVNIDMMEIRLNKCQLGLFGCGNKNNKIKPAKNVMSELKSCILMNENKGKLSCEDTWLISKKLGLEKIAVSSACEALGIRVKFCQLGAF